MKSNYTRWSVKRTLVTFIGYSLLAVAWFFAHRALHPAGQPKQVKQYYTNEELISNLYDDYKFYNEVYFGDELPKDTQFAITHHPARVGYTDRKGQRFIIEISPEKNPIPTEVDITLLHEMCHIKTYGQDFDHGPLWVGCMRDLAARGAMDYLW